MTYSRKRAYASFAFAVILGLGACSTTGQSPTGQLSLAEAAVKSATITANDYEPEALLLSKAKLERAKQAATEGRNIEARRLAEQAMVDAQLAEAIARGLRVQEELNRQRESVSNP